MREYKFRCFEKDTGMWGMDSNSAMNPEMFWARVAKIKGNPNVMQYTGLKDKNGKEIYEGDLIECSYCKKEYGEIIWNKEMYRFQLRWSNEDCGNARHTMIGVWSNVVGNIYSTPELLHA